MDVHADVESLQPHVGGRSPAETLVVDVQLAVDPSSQFAVGLPHIVDLDHVLQAVPAIALQHYPLVGRRSQHVAPVVPIGITLHVHPVGVQEHVSRRREATPVAPGLEGAVEAVVALGTDSGRSHPSVPVRPRHGCQAAADVIQVALIVVGGELDVATEVQSFVPLCSQPSAGSRSRLPAVPCDRGELDRTATGMGRTRIGHQPGPSLPQAPNLEVLLHGFRRLEIVAEDSRAGTLQAGQRLRIRPGLGCHERRVRGTLGCCDAAGEASQYGCHCQLLHSLPHVHRSCSYHAPKSPQLPVSTYPLLVFSAMSLSASRWAAAASAKVLTLLVPAAPIRP